MLWWWLLLRTLGFCQDLPSFLYRWCWVCHRSAKCCCLFATFCWWSYKGLSAKKNFDTGFFPLSVQLNRNAIFLLFQHTSHSSCDMCFRCVCPLKIFPSFASVHPDFILGHHAVKNYTVRVVMPNLQVFVSEFSGTAGVTWYSLLFVGFKDGVRVCFSVKFIN